MCSSGRAVQDMQFRTCSSAKTDSLKMISSCTGGGGGGGGGFYEIYSVLSLIAALYLLMNRLKKV